MEFDLLLKYNSYRMGRISGQLSLSTVTDHLSNLLSNKAKTPSLVQRPIKPNRFQLMIWEYHLQVRRFTKISFPVNIRWNPLRKELLNKNSISYEFSIKTNFERSAEIREVEMEWIQGSFVFGICNCKLPTE